MMPARFFLGAARYYNCPLAMVHVYSFREKYEPVIRVVSYYGTSDTSLHFLVCIEKVTLFDIFVYQAVQFYMGM